jgi:uncharacterized protein
VEILRTGLLLRINCSHTLTMYLLTALLLGAAGSLHCVGMCGPIVLALPRGNQPGMKKFSGLFLYNIGRALTYSVLGAISGLAGSALLWAGGQQTLSIVASYAGEKMKLPRFIQKGYDKVRTILGKMLASKNKSSLLFIGLMNGLLPCGLVYAALAGAAATGSWWQGALFGLIFGVGTIPALMALGIAGSKINEKFRSRLRKAVPVFITVMALLLIVRGLGLGIPYVSPEYKEKEVACCHRHK